MILEQMHVVCFDCEEKTNLYMERESDIALCPKCGSGRIRLAKGYKGDSDE